MESKSAVNQDLSPKIQRRLKLCKKSRNSSLSVRFTLWNKSLKKKEQKRSKNNMMLAQIMMLWNHSKNMSKEVQKKQKMLPQTP